jgi:hypothetical protein
MNLHASADTTHQRRLWLAAMPLLILATVSIPAQTTSPTPPGQYITPTALPLAVQQLLNPGLVHYPNFIAGEAVKEAVSPDGKTLAILTAGMNSLYDSNGSVDTGASTQFLFLYDISGANKAHPVLKQVIQQPNAHAGLVWSPNGQASMRQGAAMMRCIPTVTTAVRLR